jgi:hypothetical protein
MKGVMALSLALLLSSGCDADGVRHSDPSDVAAPGGSAPAEITYGAPADAFEPELDPGQLIVLVDVGGVRLRANQVASLRVLEALRTELGFRLELGDGVALGPPITANLSGASADEALAAVLGATPHALRYGPDPDSGRRRLLAVRVDEASDPEPDPVDLATFALRAPGPRQSEAERGERRDRNQREQIRNLASPDPAVRIEAAVWIHADPRTIPLLGDALLGDPDPAARAAAAETLGEVLDERDLREASDLLVAALEDPDPGVAIAALEALESVGDARLIPVIAGLLDHPDPGVREQAIETIEWLED